MKNHDFEEHCSCGIYNLDYYEKMLRLNSSTAEKINAIRWEWVKEVNPKIVLDFGSGVGWFRAFRPDGVEVDTYDIGLYPQTGIRHAEYDLITLWDVLEHIKILQPLNGLLERARFVSGTAPLLRKGVLLHNWKHYKPGEHVRYFLQIDGITNMFQPFGFELVKTDRPECPPREDIVSFLYSKTS